MDRLRPLARRSRFPLPSRFAFPRIGIALLLVAASCVTDKVTGKRRFALLTWSNEEEQAIGDQAAPNFEQQFGGSLPDPATQRYLGDLVKEMTTHSVRKDDFEWKFEVLDSSEPNAFALPGGYVYITRGLLQNLGSEAEFVGILGHELGHVEHQHSMLQQNKAVAATVLVGLVGVGEELLQKDPDQPNHVTALASYAAPLALLHYSRSQESEADVRGVHFAHVMGYDPREMKKTFEYFARLEQQSGGSTPEFLRSHPTNEKRIEDIDRTIRETAPEVLQKSPSQFRSPPGPSDRFGETVAALRSRSAAYQKHDQALALLAQEDLGAARIAQAQRLASEALAALPDEPLIECLAGEVQFTQGGGDRGRAHFERARALRQQRMPGKEYWKPAFYLGVIDVEAGQTARGTASLTRATKLFPDNPVAQYYLGRAKEKGGDARGAAEAYARVTQLAPSSSPLHVKSARGIERLRGGPRAAAAPGGSQ